MKDVRRTSELPDVVIAGCAKSGTTALSLMLDRHPRIYMSDIKEPNYFVTGFGFDKTLVNHDGKAVLATVDEEHLIDSDAKYRALFAGADEGMLCGDASPLYLLVPGVAARLKSHSPAVKVILMLRNPSDVVFANFVHHVRDRSESIAVDDTEQLLDESRYASAKLHPFARHLEIPDYARHLPEWLEQFDERQRHVMIFEEFRDDREAAIARVFEFLELEPIALDASDEEAVNISALPRFGWLHDRILGSVGIKRLLRPLFPTKQRRKLRLRIEAMNAGRKPSLDDTTRARLDERFVEDVAFVEELLGRPIVAWRERRGESIKGVTS